MTKNDNLHIKPRFWYAIYTKARCEKKTHDMLLLKGLHSYCPLNRIKKKYSDRKKWVEEVLFTSYLFVNINEQEKNEVRLTPGVLNFVYHEGKPAIIQDRDIVTIKKFLKEYSEVYLQKYDSSEFEVGQRVMIDAGLFMDNEATIIKVMNGKVIAKIDSLSVNMVAEVSNKDLVII
jgi:transcription antitermination factor NusG